MKVVRIEVLIGFVVVECDVGGGVDGVVVGIVVIV